MNYVTSWERLAERKGKQEGIIEIAQESDDFMDRVKYVNPGRTFYREEMNARSVLFRHQYT